MSITKKYWSSWHGVHSCLSAKSVKSSDYRKAIFLLYFLFLSHVMVIFSNLDGISSENRPRPHSHIFQSIVHESSDARHLSILSSSLNKPEIKHSQLSILVLSRRCSSGGMAPSFPSGSEALRRPIGKEVWEMSVSDDFLKKKNQGLLVTSKILYDWSRNKSWASKLAQFNYLRRWVISLDGHISKNECRETEYEI
jgi:hypothetical protein